MRSRLLLVAHGQPARDVLGAALADLRGPHPLDPATVVVARPRVGVALRRDLARRGSGVANVRFTTLAGVAEWLAAPRLGDRPRLARAALRRAALRAVLADEPGAFRDVADHPATEAALASALLDLRPLPPAALDALARRSRKAAEVVRIHRAVRQRLATWSDDHDALTTALEVVRAPASGAEATRLADLGAVVAFLPGPLAAGPRSLLEALAGARPSAAVIGLTGHAGVDEPARALADELAGAFGPPLAAEVAPPVLAEVVGAPDAPSEVRTAVGLLLDRATAGVPLPELALLYPAVGPYAAIVADQLQAAEIPWHGPSRRTLADTLTGTVLLGVLALADDGRLARDGVVDWLSSAPIRRADGQADDVPAARWDVLSRRAGVVAGRAEWDGRLARLAHGLRADADRLAADPDAEVAARHLATNADQADALRAFVGELDGRLSGGRPTTWAGLVAWAEALLDRYLGPPGPAGSPARTPDRTGVEGAGAGWPADELAAREAVTARLRSLAVLDDLPGAVPPPDPAELRRAVARELAAPAPGAHPQGHGVFVGPISTAVGLPLTAAVVIGLVEGVLPARWRDDPLLPEHERAGVEALASRWARSLDQQADLVAIVAGVPHVVATWARTDGDGRPVLASRYLAELAPPLAAAAGPVAAVPVVAVPEPVSLADLTLGELTRAHRAGRLDAHPFVVGQPALARALAIRRERRWGGFGPFEGRVGPSPVLSPPGGVELSPTALETYAACPRRFLFEKVLEVEALDRPEEILELSAAHRGSLIHDVLERFVRRSPQPTHPDAPWDDDARARLHALVDEVGAEYEHQGLTGRPLLWLLGRRRILRDLDDFLQADQALRRAWGVVPAVDGLEVSFGLRDTTEAAVAFPLPDGQTVRFRGRIDRVDRSPDGRRLVVIDYKTGSRRGTERVREGVGRGTKLQLPIYGLAAAQRFPADEVVSLYWFVSRRERFHQEPLHVDEEVLGALGRSVQGLVAGIAGGSFPARPGKPDQSTFEHCRFCDYDVACSPHRAHTWERLRRDPALAGYVGLVEPEALVDQLALEVTDA